MRLPEGGLIKRVMGPSLPFLFPADLNANLKAGTQAVILDPRRKSHVEAGGTRRWKKSLNL